jgi:hypothetical protein
MHKSLIAHSYEDILTVAAALAAKAEEAMNMVSLRLNHFGLQSDKVVVVVPGETRETVAREILDALAS